MITKKQYQDILRDKTRIEKPAKAVLSKIKSLNITPSTDLKKLKAQFKAHLFGELLQEDNGLQKRYNMLRTDEAKLSLIEQTINIDGYNEIVELEKLLATYKQVFSNFNYYFNNEMITVESFLLDYEGKVENALKNRIIDTVDTPLYKELEIVSNILNDMYKRGVLNEHCFSNGFWQNLGYFLVANPFEKKIEVNETTIYNYLRKN